MWCSPQTQSDRLTGGHLALKGVYHCCLVVYQVWTILAQFVAGFGPMSCARLLPWPLVSGRLKGAET